MNIALWIIASLLDAVFAIGGFAKLALPKQKLTTAPGGQWTEGFSSGAIKAIGALDLLAAAGLILPAALGIAPLLVPLAAFGLVLTMIGAIHVHVRHGETNRLAVPIVVLALAFFVLTIGVRGDAGDPDPCRSDEVQACPGDVHAPAAAGGYG